MKYAQQKQLRSDTSNWPNSVTIGMHTWSHLHSPLRIAKRDINQQLQAAGKHWTAAAVARVMTEAMTQKDARLPPDITPGELTQCDCNWLAIIWNQSAGLIDQLDQINPQPVMECAA